MNKIPDALENPVDRAILQATRRLLPLLRRTGQTGPSRPVRPRSISAARPLSLPVWDHCAMASAPRKRPMPYTTVAPLTMPHRA